MKLKLIIFVTGLVMVSSAAVSAQTSRYYKKGYHGSFELGTGVGVGKMDAGFVLDDNHVFLGEQKPGELIRLSTVHGYSLGNGIFIGGGLGWNFELFEGAQYASAFADMKYNFFDASVCPFIEGRAGYYFQTNGPRYETGGMFVSVATGVDFGRFSARLGYEFSPLKQNYRDRRGELLRYYYSLNQFFFTVSFNL